MDLYTKLYGKCGVKDPWVGIDCSKTIFSKCFECYTGKCQSLLADNQLLSPFTDVQQEACSTGNAFLPAVTRETHFCRTLDSKWRWTFATGWAYTTNVTVRNFLW